jgi:sterol desaturase/sphingolipid hydroxylase (fatty acid hydroxylase superfamily)
MYKLVKRTVSKAGRRRKKTTRKLRGSQEIRQAIDLGKVVAIGVVVIVMVLAVGNYALSMMQATGVGNATIYNQGQQMLSNIASGYSNVVNIALLAIIIMALAVVILTVERW